MEKVYYTVTHEKYDSNPIPLTNWYLIGVVVANLVDQGLRAYVTVEYRPEQQEESRKCRYGLSEIWVVCGSCLR